MISDEELYQRLLSGDEGALEALVHRYHNAILGFLIRQVGDRHTAEDLVQETFTRLVTYEGEPPRRFRAWAFTIASNLARDYFRSAYHRRENPDSFEVWGEVTPDLGPEPVEPLLREDDRQAVAQALEQLPPAQREVVLLRFYQEMKLEEIADVTGAPLGTVKSRLFHALRYLKAYLEQEGGHLDARPQPDRRIHH